MERRCEGQNHAFVRFSSKEVLGLTFPRLVGCKNPELKIFAESLDGFIINFDEKKSHTIWLNYKILEAEIERISAQ